MERQVQNLQQELNTIKDEKAQILQEKADLLAKSTDETQVNLLKLQLEETNKVNWWSHFIVDMSVALLGTYKRMRENN